MVTTAVANVQSRLLTHRFITGRSIPRPLQVSTIPKFTRKKDVRRFQKELNGTYIFIYLFLYYFQ